MHNQDDIKFIHLRVQSSYSFLESAIKVEQVVEKAKNNGMESIALCDRNNLFASLEFSILAKQNLIKPIHGVILNLDYGKLISADSNKYFAQILILAKDQGGYQNLLKLASYPYIKNPRDVTDHITVEDLFKHGNGLIVLSAYHLGVVGKALAAKKFEAAKRIAGEFQKHFGDRFYFEIMRHGYEEETNIEADYLKIAQQMQIPLVATNHVVFGSQEDHEAYGILSSLSDVKNKSVGYEKKTNINCYFKSPQEMRKLFADLPEAIENSYYISLRCSARAMTRDPICPSFKDFDDKFGSETEYLRFVAKEGLKLRLAQKSEEIEINTEEYYDRLKYELDIICSMNFAGYFLIVSEFIKWSKKNNIAVGPGRGSGAGSIVAWSLEITDLDPIEFGLLFERFLNPERISMPDFDIDFCQERREEVIEHVQKTYGEGRVGQIITFGKMQAKAVIKDVARVLGLPYKIADRLSALVPFNAVNPVTLSDALAQVPELKNAIEGKGLYDNEQIFQTDDDNKELLRKVLETALILEGLHRHASTHAAGVVIANEDLIETVPLYKDPGSSMNVVQYSMKYCELAGLVKFDFLGLQTLTVITKCLDLLKTQGIEIQLSLIKNRDIKTFKMMSEGLSTGVFQFESTGMKNSLRKLKPDCLEDLIALGALYRPGPMDNIPTFIACKHGFQKADYLHPTLEPILKETYGVIVYQEQVMEIAKRLAGYSLGAADLLRRAMGKKVKAEMDAQREIFVSGAQKNNVRTEQAESIFETVAKFAGYGFNKAHASAYGVISYQTAYLKANYPGEFLVASMNLSIDDSDKISIFIQDAKNFDIEIIPPCVNKSDGFFSVYIDPNTKQKSIVYALGAIKNVVPNFGNKVRNLAKKRHFTDIIDFVERVELKNINKRVIENLIKAGAFDSLHESRSVLLENLPQIISYGASYHEEKSSPQALLFSISQDGKKPLLAAIKNSSNNSSLQEEGAMEFEVLGLFLVKHPLREYQNMLAQFPIKDSAYINCDLENGNYSNLLISGVIIKKDAKMSGRGRFIILKLLDLSGVIELTIYNENLIKDYGPLMEVSSLVIVTVDINKDDDSVRILPKKFETISYDLYAKNNVTLEAKSENEFRELISILRSAENKNSGAVEFTSAQILMPVSYFGMQFKVKIAVDKLTIQPSLVQDFIVNKSK